MYSIPFVCVYTVPRPRYPNSGFVGSFLRLSRAEYASALENPASDISHMPIHLEIDIDEETLVIFSISNDVQFDENTAEIHNAICDAILNGEVKVTSS